MRAHLPENATLKRDTGKGLYVTNAPRLGWRGEIPGFRVEISEFSARIYADKPAMEACGLPPCTLALELERFRGASDESLELFSRIIKALEARDCAELASCEREVRSRAAVALRCGGGEGLYYCALILGAGSYFMEETL